MTVLRRLLALLLLLAAAPVVVAASEDPRARLEQVEADLEKLEGWLRSSRIDRDRARRRAARERPGRRGDGGRRARGGTGPGRPAPADRGHRGRHRGADATGSRAARGPGNPASLRLAPVPARPPAGPAARPNRPTGSVVCSTITRTLTRRRLEALERWEQARDALDERRSELAREAERLREERDRLAARVAELERTRSERERVLAALEARIDQRAGRPRGTAPRPPAPRPNCSSAWPARRDNRPAAPSPMPGAVCPGRSTPRILRAFGSDGEGGLAADGVMLQAEAGTPVRAVRRRPGGVRRLDAGLRPDDHRRPRRWLHEPVRPGRVAAAGRRRHGWKRVKPSPRPGSPAAARDPGVWFEIRSNGRPRDPVIWCEPRGQA
ncbi:MAG: hypothetical protein U5R48_11070 [Gammaproteobacteria bacterium]|nr:hypothetical protein [Gammaproteobacteria bacterium]